LSIILKKSRIEKETHTLPKNKEERKGRLKNVREGSRVFMIGVGGSGRRKTNGEKMVKQKNLHHLSTSLAPPPHPLLSLFSLSLLSLPISISLITPIITQLPRVSFIFLNYT
jgi:hypothetical protein